VLSFALIAGIAEAAVLLGDTESEVIVGGVGLWLETIVAFVRIRQGDECAMGVLGWD
jgi:hypothetical protein